MARAWKCTGDMLHKVFFLDPFKKKIYFFRFTSYLIVSMDRIVNCSSLVIIIIIICERCYFLCEKIKKNPNVKIKSSIIFIIKYFQPFDIILMYQSVHSQMNKVHHLLFFLNNQYSFIVLVKRRRSPFT